MQQLTEAPRDSLTEAQVTRLLVGAPKVDYDRGCEVLDAALNVVDDISSDFEGGTVTHTALADVHGTCSLTLATDIDYGTQLVRPYMTLTAEGVTARFNLGAYALRKPQTDYGYSIPSNQVDGSDRLFLLNRPVGDAYAVASGTAVLAAAKQAIVDAGLDGSTVLVDSTAAAKTLPSDHSWPLLADSTSTDALAPPDAMTSMSQSGPTTWLRIVNDLLAMVGYRGVWADENGYFRFTPYADPADRPVEFSFDFDDIDDSVIAGNRTAVQDFSTVPNVWVFLQQNLTDGSGNPIEPTEGAGQYTVTNQSDGPASIDARGGLEWISVVQLDAADQASLVSQGDAQVAADKRVTKQFTVATAPFPAAGHFDVYTYSDLAAAGGAVKVQETAWTLDLGNSTTVPADMQRTWQQV